MSWICSLLKNLRENIISNQCKNIFFLCWNWEKFHREGRIFTPILFSFFFNNLLFFRVKSCRVQFKVGGFSGHVTHWNFLSHIISLMFCSKTIFLPAVSPNPKHCRCRRVLLKSSSTPQTSTNIVMTFVFNISQSSKRAASQWPAGVPGTVHSLWLCLKPLLVVNSFIDPNLLLLVCLFFLQDKFWKHQRPVPHVPSHPGIPHPQRNRRHAWTHGWVVRSQPCIVAMQFLFPSCWWTFVLFFFRVTHCGHGRTFANVEETFPRRPLLNLLCNDSVHPLCTQPTSEPPVFTTQTVELYLNSSRQLRSVWFHLTQSLVLKILYFCYTYVLLVYVHVVFLPFTKKKKNCKMCYISYPTLELCFDWLLCAFFFFF